LQIEVPVIAAGVLLTPLDRVADGDSSAVMRERVATAMPHQCARQGMPNAWLQPKDVSGWVRQTSALQRYSGRIRAWSLRARVIDSSRFGERSPSSPRAIAANHVAQALGYRCLDRS
jgi:predicted ATPase with chaperone activity